MKKTLALLLAVLMIVGVFAGCGDKASKPADGTTGTDTPAVKNENKVIVGSTTDLAGDFRWPGFGGSSAGAADQDVNGLIVGYATMETNQGGAYVWNDTAVKAHSETEDENGNLVITIEINPGLKFSDGSEIKAANYIASILAFSTNVSVQAGHTGRSGQAFVGFDSFNAYNGEEAEGATKEFAGIRLLDEYTFSMTVKAPDYYPYYFANTYGAVSPEALGLVLGEGVEVKDDGNGAYLTEAWYEKDAEGAFVKAAHLKAARYDWNTYPVSGPYYVSDWDDSTKIATLTINPEFTGNFEGQKPSIKTIVYTKIVQETQLDQFKTGQIDILSGVTGGDDTKAALAVVDESNGKFDEVHYQRAGYGKLQFECDFGPTMFASVRKAVAYVLNTSEFAEAFTGGYGTVVYGPYSPDFDMWVAVEDEINLIDYSFSVENAKQALIDGGWIYNETGAEFVEGTDTVRYKKLTAEEATDVNIAYASVANTDGKEYKTVKVGDDYYMPCVINWFGTTPNDVTDMLGARLVGTENVAAIGMVVRSTTGDFDKLLGEIYRETSYGYGGTPTFGMFNLATGWNSAVYDYAYNWSLDPIYFGYSANKLFDEYDVAFPYYAADGTHTKMSYEDAMAASGNKLGMDYLSMAMVYDAANVDEYNQWWKAYIERWNDLMPDIPLYSNYYFDVYNAKIENFQTSPFWGPTDALLYCTIANAE
ncbi:MAG: hypothetical protein IJZ48_06830 [Oscillospiraceae bacterium]|nr:hypothetical protein [Oscillospiraceae bacterium]